MELKIVDTKNLSQGKIKLPPQFSELIRPDLVKRAVFAIQSHNRQPYGADPEAGLRASAELSRRRRKYRGSYGHGISRVPRKILTRRGTRFYWVGAVAPGTVGGRKAHAPTAEKILAKKINKKENRKAIRSALAASIVKELAMKRGHAVPDSYPFIVDDKAQLLSKTKEVRKFLESIGLKKELERSSKKKIRSGKGKMRGRRYQKRKGPLIVVSADCPLLKSSSNIPGVDIVKIREINAELLAPGAEVGRLTIYTKSAIEKLDKEKLFYDKLRVRKEKKTEEKKEIKKEIKKKKPVKAVKKSKPKK